jgi:hypothetical protein
VPGYYFKIRVSSKKTPNMRTIEQLRGIAAEQLREHPRPKRRTLEYSAFTA